MARSSDIPQFGLLSGLKVISCGGAVAEPHAAALMAEYGADVVQVESTLGLTMGRNFAPSFGMEARNKRFINLNTPKAPEIFTRMLQWADVFLESSKPGQYDKWGFDDDTLMKINPRLVVVHISGFGQTGDPDYVQRAGMDVTGQAFSGKMIENGMPEPNPPLLMKPGICDYTTGLFACWSALAGVIHAKETGEGDIIDLAQYEALLRLGYGPTQWFKSGVQLMRCGNAEASVAGINSFLCADDKYVVIQISGPRMIKGAAAILGLEDHPVIGQGKLCLRGTEEGDTLDAALTDFCAQHEAMEVDRIFNEAKIACCAVMDYAMLAENPHIAAREDFVEWYDDASGAPLKGATVLPHVKNNPGRIWRGSQKPGFDNEDVLTDLGYSPEEIASFYEQGLITKAQ